MILKLDRPISFSFNQYSGQNKSVTHGNYHVPVNCCVVEHIEFKS